MLFSIARHELVEQWRHKTLKILLPLLISLTVLVAVSHWQQQQDYIAVQQQWQQTNNEKWEAQPDRHPHRAAHYGAMLFRIISPLSFIDAGVNPFVGNVLFLEAHRQNSSQFKQYLSSHSYMQLGYLSGSTLILVVWPLVLIALAYKSISGERQQGTLRQIISLGVSFRQMILGKALAFLFISLLFLALVFSIAAIFLVMAGVEADVYARFFMLFVLYFLYCVIWGSLILFVSTLSRANNQSLSTSLLLWLVMVIVLPKLAYAAAEWRYPLPDKAVFDIQTAQAVAKVGDSHDPDDPYFNDFRQQTLKKYGVDRVEDLPVNWKGLLMQEGERITSEVFEKQYGQLLDQIAKQNAWVSRWSLLSPFLVTSRLSNLLSATSYQQIRQYEEAAEDYRYNLIQSLNDLHINEVDMDHDNSEQRISKSHWSELAEFNYQPAKLNEEWTFMSSSAAMIGLWLMGLLAAIMAIRPKVTLS
ncbi:ABC transporter permease [Methylophaga sulfidovorans]|uniref:ABC-2 type transport system permease protein n=1 Tax=Methylophaga sulfidovorans TaxID=45496 RepID=A0A1I3ZYV0_9GAMM|nr:DUF3526 domain-containing protein [Methylophaga sulfidovorans]SFK49255.1 ABC-2 type transport system permease protein [Methylophaga sulfidovorans]